MKIQSILKLEEGSLDGYYLAQKAADLWHEDNPDKSRDQFWRIGVDVQDKYTEKAGGKKGAYQGKGVSNWTTESLQSLAEHVKRQVPLCDSIFRYQSEAYFDTFKTAKKLREAGSLPELDWESEEMLGTDIGESVELKGVGRVWLDVPYLNEEYDEVDEAQGSLRKGLATVGVLAALMGANHMTSAKHTPLGKELQQAAQAGDTVAAYHLKNLDLYADAGDQRTLTNLKIAYIDDSPRDDVKAYLTKKAGVDEAKGPNYDASDIWRGDAVTCKQCKGKGCNHCDHKGVHPKGDVNEAEYQGKDVQLNKPKRGGSKKYYVYVKTPKGNVKKISFGDVTGLKTKASNKKAAKSFAARHNCEKKNDKQKAGYWACRLPRYGLVKGGKWW
jgi:hypothetical protein